MSPAARACRRAIVLYQTARAGRPTTCRFTPTCSSYALDAVEQYGAYRGVLMAARRLSRCHPWGSQGWDPVPERTH